DCGNGRALLGIDFQFAKSSAGKSDRADLNGRVGSALEKHLEYRSGRQVYLLHLDLQPCAARLGPEIGVALRRDALNRLPGQSRTEASLLRLIVSATIGPNGMGYGQRQKRGR